MNGHAAAAPSAWDQWSACPGSISLQASEPDVDSEYAREGTQAHTYAASALTRGWEATELAAEHEHMREPLERYVASVNARVEQFKTAGALEVVLLVEQRLPIDAITGERNAFGTADAVIIAQFAASSLIEVDDLKFGQGVEVDVQDNGQLQIYALAAVLKYRLLHNFTSCVMRIHQPRIRQEPLEWEIPIEQLYDFGNTVAASARIALELLEAGPVAAIARDAANGYTYLKPGEKQCKFCRARWKCPAIAKEVNDTVFGDFDVITAPGAALVEKTPPVLTSTFIGSADEYAAMLPVWMSRVPLIEEWCLSIRGQVEIALLRGDTVAGYKLVQGRAGARAWTAPDAVQLLLTGAHLMPSDYMSKPELLSPAQLEKNVKPKDKPELWAALREQIKQAEGKPSVAPATDPRAPWQPATVDDFTNYDGSDIA